MSDVMKFAHLLHDKLAKLLGNAIDNQPSGVRGYEYKGRADAYRSALYELETMALEFEERKRLKRKIAAEKKNLVNKSAS